MEIFELAASLGQLLKQDRRLVELERAKDAYESNTELQAMLAEFDAQQATLQAEVTKPDRDMHLVDAVQARIDELYGLITGHQAFVELNEAQAVVSDLMNTVNSTIMAQITGEEPSGCTHNCATCGGCH